MYRSCLRLSTRPARRSTSRWCESVGPGTSTASWISLTETSPLGRARKKKTCNRVKWASALRASTWLSLASSLASGSGVLVFIFLYLSKFRESRPFRGASWSWHRRGAGPVSPRVPSDMRTGWRRRAGYEHTVAAVFGLDLHVNLCRSPAGRAVRAVTGVANSACVGCGLAEPRGKVQRAQRGVVALSLTGARRQLDP